MSFFGKLFVGFLVLVLVLVVIGFLQSRRGKKGPTIPGAEERRPEEDVENAADLNDRFNRARYQDKDGQ